MDIHRTERSVKACLKSILESEHISKEDKELINKFHNECYSQGLSHTRVVFYLDKLKMICLKWSQVSLSSVGKDDIKETVAKIEKNDYSERTKEGYKITLKKLFQFVDGYEWKSKEYPDIVKWIRASNSNKNKKLPDDLLTEEDVMKLVKNATHIRDKALISSLYESGCRIGELLTVKLKNIEFDDYGCVIRVFGKTGSRRVRLITSVPHLTNWLESHPNKNDSESYLWVSIGSRNHAKMVGYGLVRKILQRTARISGIQKSINPHAFRHSRATHLANKLTEAQMKEYFGWVQGSEMASTYVHLSGRDIDQAILEIHGKLPKDKEKKEKLTVKECPRCYHQNSPESDFCYRCHLPLNEKVALELENKESAFVKMITTDMIEKMIERKVKELLKN